VIDVIKISELRKVVVILPLFYDTRNRMQYKGIKHWTFIDDSHLALKQCLTNVASSKRSFQAVPSESEKFTPVFPQMPMCPTHFETNFAERTRNIAVATLHNLFWIYSIDLTASVV
jgi:hypothetical protein